MGASFDLAVPVILEHEGGGKFSNHAADHGGATRWGITARTLGEWMGLSGPCTPAAVENLSREEAIAIYRDRYWRPCRCDEIEDQLVAVKLFDMAVNCGPRAAVKLLQRALNRVDRHVLAVDGEFGPATLSAVNESDPGELVVELVHVLTEHYLAIIAVNPSQRVFKRGWLRRARFPFDPDVVPSEVA